MIHPQRGRETWMLAVMNDVGMILVFKDGNSKVELDTMGR